MEISKYGGHLGRHLEFQSYSSLLKKVVHPDVVAGGLKNLTIYNNLLQETMFVKPLLPLG